MRATLPLVLTSTALAVLAAPGAGQVNNPPQPLEFDREWSPGGSGLFRDSAVGDFDGNLVADVVTSRGNDLEVMLDPILLGAVETGFAPGGVFTVLPGSAQDELLVIGPAGLGRLTRDPGGWIHTPMPTGPVSWVEARQLELRHVAGGEPQIVAVLADARTVHGLDHDGSAYATVSEELFVAPDTIVRIAAFDRDGDGDPEIGVITADRLYVYERNGTSQTWDLVTAIAADGYLGVDLVAGSQGNGKEWLFWLSNAPSGTSQYYGIIDDGPFAGPQLLFGDDDVVRVATGNWNGDDADDVALSWRVDGRAGVLLNENQATASFDVVLDEFDVTSTPSAPAPHNSAEPVLADLDDDGDAEFCLAVQDEAREFVRFGSVEDSNDASPQPIVYFSEPGVDPTHILLYRETPDPHTHYFAYEAPETWPRMSGGTPLPLDLEVKVFQMDSATEDPELVTTVYRLGLLPSSHPVSVDYDRPETSTPIPDKFFFFAARYADPDSSERFPYRIVGYHAQGLLAPGQAAHQQLLDWGGFGPTYDVAEDVVEPDPPARTYAGTGIALPTLPSPPGS